MTCVCELRDPEHGFAPDHCLSCHRDQPSSGYIRCFECGHTYRTRLHLLWHYWRTSWGLRPWRPTPSPLDLPQESAVAFLWHLLTRRPGEISFCQCCIHDF